VKSNFRVKNFPRDENELFIRRSVQLIKSVPNANSDVCVKFLCLGCVRMKYISQDEGIAVNVSYGESLLHSEQVKGPNPEPTCMSLLANLAQVCARFSDLQPYNDGLRGCLLLEPKLLGDVTTSFNIGCFTMGPEGMKLEESANSTVTTLLQSENENNNKTQ
jgi:hypothetical protein